jgi:hypothetical protein
MLDLPRNEKTSWFRALLSPICGIVWALTVFDEFTIGHFIAGPEEGKGTDGSAIQSAAVFAAATFATALFGLLYFLSQWSQSAKKGGRAQTSASAILTAWLSMICSTIVCLIGVLGFGIAGFNLCISDVFRGEPRPWQGWLPPLVFVSLEALGVTWMLVGVIIFYFRQLRLDVRSVDDDEKATTPSESDALTGCGFVPWRTYCDSGILIFIGLGIVCLRLLIGARASQLTAAVDLVLSLLFGVFAVGMYAAGINEYLTETGKHLSNARRQKSGK